MARAGGLVHRLQPGAAIMMEDVQAVRQANEVMDIGQGAGAPPAVDIRDKGRAAHGGEQQRVAPDGQGLCRVAGVDGELGRQPNHHLLDQRRIEANPVVGPVDIGADPLHQRQRRLIIHPHADIAQNLQRGDMD